MGADTDYTLKDQLLDSRNELARTRQHLADSALSLIQSGLVLLDRDELTVEEFFDTLSRVANEADQIDIHRHHIDFYLAQP